MINRRGRWSPLPDDVQVNHLSPVVRPDTAVNLIPVPGVETRPARALLAFTMRAFGQLLGADRFSDHHLQMRRTSGAPVPMMASWDGPNRTRVRTPPSTPWEGPPEGMAT